MNEENDKQSTAQYNDPDHIPDENEIRDEINQGVEDKTSSKLADWIRHKQYGVDVREALALFVEWISVKLNGVVSAFNGVEDRQSDVEKRQSNVEDQFKTVIANATKDSEVILARDSKTYGTYVDLDDRLENIEGMLAKSVPSGFVATLTHNLGYTPRVSASYYENAIGTETDGLGTNFAGGFGEINEVQLSIFVSYPDSNTVRVEMPMKFAMTGTPVVKPDGNFYLINGFKTIKFDFGGAVKNGSGEVALENPEAPDSPSQLTASEITDQSAKLNWR
ncbi:hypothetical protein [Lacticaseibacillus paracasei]|uniref:Baseplate upper protein immunoglobulin like domain-containing protein n=1 Tax=Lacticaseibacillus paracasei TaxID=1597 RepID=A0AAP4JL48_LACPA|nr:hypothetical protein [Lacticaseibacillus paracasei]MDM7455223.1 hypothetical protein [Lacticaseibacillus paracasei]MDM7472007.1 hypothetical protein [Lacticaseibacillus paracasei]